jgi:hypothetical protein
MSKRLPAAEIKESWYSLFGILKTKETVKLKKFKYSRKTEQIQSNT